MKIGPCFSHLLLFSSLFTSFTWTRGILSFFPSLSLRKCVVAFFSYLQRKKKRRPQLFGFFEGPGRQFLAKLGYIVENEGSLLSAAPVLLLLLLLLWLESSKSFSLCWFTFTYLSSRNWRIQVDWSILSTLRSFRDARNSITRLYWHMYCKMYMLVIELWVNRCILLTSRLFRVAKKWPLQLLTTYSNLWKECICHLFRPRTCTLQVRTAFPSCFLSPYKAVMDTRFTFE